MGKMFISPIIESGHKKRDGTTYYDYVWMGMRRDSTGILETLFCDVLSDLFGGDIHDAVCREGKTVEVETSIVEEEVTA